MKKLLSTLAIMIFTSMMMGQTHNLYNYVKTTSYQVETQDGITSEATQAILSDDEKIENITYYDGLGRPEQSISKHAGGDKEDIVTPFVYDQMGRLAKEHLPYADQSALLGEELSFRDPTTLMSNLNNYYLAKYPTELVTASPNPYSEKHFEASPLNRVLEQGAPGSAWAVDFNTDNDHTIKFEYETNTLDLTDSYADNVIDYDVIFPSGDTEEPELFFSGYYAPNELYKTVTKDENWNETVHGYHKHLSIEYKNKQGQVVLKRNFNEKIPHDTYYVYDDYGNLTYVVSPSGNDKLLVEGIYKPYRQIIKYNEFIGKGNKGDPEVLGEGVVNISLEDSTQELVVSFDLHYASPVELLQGKIVDLAVFTPDMVIGTITNGSANYQLSVVDNALYITGSGFVQNITDIFIVDLPTFIPDPTVLNDYGYEYHYDSRNRLIEKKIPGKGWEFIVYDKLDRPVLTQDANLRNTDDWLFTKYDHFDRVVYTGIYHYREAHYTNSNEEEIRKRLQEEVDFQGSNLSEVRMEDTTPTVIGNLQFYHANKVIPKVDIEVYTINYYDTYPPDITGAGSSGEFTDPVNVVLNGVTVSTTDKTNSLSTGTRVRVLDTNDWITSVSYYDDKARPIYSASENEYLGTLDVTKSRYDFVGKVLETVTEHNKGTNPVISTQDSFTFDHAGRLKSQKQKIDTNPAELIVNNHYDRFGQLEGKDVGNTEAAPLQTVSYDYNIRGWMTKINDVNSLGSSLFGFQISYNDMVYNNVQALYNGNITETIWSTKSTFTNHEGNPETELVRAYSYHYDQLNRIKMGIYEEEDAVRDEWYSLKEVDYDKNGNIIELRRSGVDNNINHIPKMDNLSYFYSGNQLTNIVEAGDTAYGFKEIAAVSLDYVYDANGNLISDANKGITNIKYNLLNLPTKVTFDANNDITYIYDATGIKLEKQVKENGVMTYTRYAGNYIYEEATSGEELKFMNHAEGYVEPSATNGYDYVYQYKDHLGNVRLSYKNLGTTSTPSLEILEENNYYPFGLKHKGYNSVVNSTNIALKRMFGGKEYQDELELAWYDVTARNYDPAIGRWMNIDPLAEKMRRHSPYNFGFNNPIYFQDYDGMMPQGPGGPWNPINGIGGGIVRAFKSKMNSIGNSFSRGWKNTKSTVAGWFKRKGGDVYTAERMSDGKRSSISDEPDPKATSNAEMKEMGNLVTYAETKTPEVEKSVEAVILVTDIIETVDDASNNENKETNNSAEEATISSDNTENEVSTSSTVPVLNVYYKDSDGNSQVIKDTLVGGVNPGMTEKGNNVPWKRVDSTSMDYIKKPNE